MSNIKWYDIKMTSNTTPAPFEASASSYYDASFPAWKAFDGISNTTNRSWMSKGIENEWVQIKLDEPKFLDTALIYARSEDLATALNYTPKDFDILGSNDGLNFEVIGSFTNSKWLYQNSTTYNQFNFNNERKSFLYYRVLIKNNQSSGYVTNLNEVFLGTSIIKKAILKNQSINQYYSLAEKTLILLPDASDKNMILYGIEAGTEIKLDESFDKIRTITDNEDGTQTVTDETVDPFSVYDYISENPQVVVYTESEDDITVSTTTEPFTLYDEFGDEVEVLFYTDDDTVTDADLILEANWSPIDELDGNFEVVTWTDEGDSTRTLEMSAIPKPQLIRKSTVSDIGGTLNGIIANTTSSNVRFLLTNNNSTWYKWNGSTFENVTFAKVDDILTLGNTQDELANADYSKWTHSKINIGAFLKDDDTTTSKVNELGIITNSPIRTSQVSDLNFYILNTTAKIELDLKGLWLSGQLSDLDLTRVQYRVFLNEQPYYPLSGDFTSLDNPPLNIDITFKSEEIKINDWNTLRVEFKDSFGTVDYWQTTFVGNYSSLMFADTDGNYYSDDVGKVLQYLDFGTFFGGQYSVEHEVIIKNQYGYDVENVMIEASTGHLPEGVDVQFSDIKDPFIPQANLLLPNELKHEEEVSFYIRMISDIDSIPNGENKFNIFVKAERKV